MRYKNMYIIYVCLQLLSGSRELIDLNFGPNETQGLVKQASRDAYSGKQTDVYDTEAEEVGVTYEQLNSIIETVLVESGYYDMSPKIKPGTSPLASIGSVDIFNSRHMSLSSA